MNLITKRTIDELGRIVIPAEIREKLDVKPKDIMDIYIEDNSIIMKKNENVPHCSICGTANNLTELSQPNHYICEKCKKEISELK